jgi:hypothetical protein
MIGMKLSLLGVLLCALPLGAQVPAQAPSAGAASVAAYPPRDASEAPSGTSFPKRVVAPCALTTASLGPSGEESPTDGRGFAIHIANDSAIPVDLPTYPEFGWRVDTQQKNNSWKLKAEGGPVRRVGSADDPHVAVVGQTGSGPMVKVVPTAAREYRFFLPGVDRALRHEGKLTTLRLSVYWAASAAMRQSDPAAPNCAVTADWTVTIRP